VGYRTEKVGGPVQLLQHEANPGVLMDTYTQLLQRVFVDLLDEPSETSSMDAQNDADVARSEKNVLEWMEYLPEDCIRTMIQMGWDVTT
jgi:hypothetical protein